MLRKQMTRTKIFTYEGTECYAMYSPADWKAKGKTKSVYIGSINNTLDERIASCAIKKYRNSFKVPVEKHYLQQEVQGSKVAAQIAEKFNRTYGYYPYIDFIIPILGEIDTGKEKYVLIEPFLEGTYFKYTDNNGYENKRAGQIEILVAFCHWTYKENNELLMVTDLQGVEYEHCFRLTDPAIHSVNKKYGPMDCGEDGIKKVLSHHTCNSVCKRLGIENKCQYKDKQQMWKTLLSLFTRKR